MIDSIKEVLQNCPCDGMIYLAFKLSDHSGFFISKKHLLYMVFNTEDAPSQRLSTEFLRLYTNIEINAIESDQQFGSGRYNVIELLPVEEKYDDVCLDSFVNLCNAHTKLMGAQDFIKFFYSLVSLFQYPKEQKYSNLIGLFGELSFLKYAYHEMGVDLSENWHITGSSDKYDIVLSSCNIEIKTTMTPDESVVIKHAQLFNSDHNYLVRVVTEENNNGVTVNQLIEELLSDGASFNSFNFAINIEKEKQRISPVDAGEKRFMMKSVTIYDASIINPFFTVPERVTSLTYKLDLCASPTVDFRTLLDVIK
jgi:hypothetical protein